MPSEHSLIRKVVFVLFIAAIITGATLLLGTEDGKALLSRPHRYGARAKTWVAAHPYSAPAIYIGAFVSLGVLALPVWWLEVLAGLGFGLSMGILWSLIASTIAAAGAAALSEFMLGEWFHKRVETHVARLQKLDDKLGHNGLLVVSLVRLAHFIPFGPANIVFGISRVSVRDVAIGTLVGGGPSITILVVTGAAPHLFRNVWFWTILAGINLLLLALIGLRYLWPEWFEKMGVE